jgi:hypothetical protein
VGLEHGPLSLVRITEELLEWKSSSFVPRKPRLTAGGYPLRWPRDTFYPQKLALTSQTSGGRSIGIVCLRTKATEFFLYKHIAFFGFGLREVNTGDGIRYCLGFYNFDIKYTISESSESNSLKEWSDY